MKRNSVWGYTNFEGQPAPTQYNGFLPGFATGSYTGLTQAVWTVEGNGQYIVYGGEFLAVNGTPQQGLVRFSASGGDANDQGDNGDNGDNGKDKDKKKNKKDKKNKKKNKKNQDDWDNQEGDWDQDDWDNNQNDGWWWW